MKKKWIPVWIVPVLLIFSIGTVWLRLFMVRTTYSINQINRTISQLRQQKELLQLKLAALRSPGKLESLARIKFGLTQPRTEQIIHLTEMELIKNDQ